LDVLLELAFGRIRVVLGLLVFAEQVFGDEVDARIGALSRKNGRNQQLERIAVLQRRADVRVFFLEPADDFRGVAAELVGGVHGAGNASGLGGDA
jgi:hypothetical protein